MIVGPPSKRPMEFAFCLCDRVLVDAGDAALHQPVGVELPVLVAIGAEPAAAVVAIFIGEADGDAVAGMGPDFLDQPVVELARPFARQEGFDRRRGR